MKRIFATAIFVVISGSAFAQQPPVMLRLSVEEVNAIIGHLEGKWSELNPLVQSIITQTNTQLNARNQPPKIEEKKTDKNIEEEKPKDKESKLPYIQQ